ncbi:MAG TPA: YceI family protein [Jatrophihabitantaceae bacterium]|jgi:polyisoprenoid-binding protein YceI
MNSAPTTIAIPGYLAGIWKADPAKSTIAFSVRQVLVTTVRGRFTGHDVTIVTGEDPLGSSVAVTIDLASVDTGNPKRDDHISSAPFLDAAKHPTMSYRSTGIRRAEDGWVVDGELTVHGVTRPVPLAVAQTRFGPGPTGEHRAGFSATARINRGDFGIDRWTGGGAVVSDKVSISLEIEAVLQK